ncbi:MULTISPECIES: DUF397 domain-containing protein [Actinomadura]|uniref:DUF397 domain-containing protein n=1 Tax=Actinomadura yumaensis TaxID=111807 RepID=A0ABW2CPP4_9ACTN|nr:DUF397 domain-containing protein [Actinomadura sp. J1-007]
MTTWRKSSHSGTQHSDCVEVTALAPAVWRKSWHSGDDGGNCVELASSSGKVGVRDSKDAAGGVLVFARSDFRVFVEVVKRR